MDSTISAWVSPREVAVVRGRVREAPSGDVLVRADPRVEERHLVTPVHDAVVAVLAERKRAARPVEVVRLVDPVYLVVDESVRADVLIDVMYSIGRAGITGYEFALTGSDGEGAVVVGRPPCRDGANSETCVIPEFSIADAGVFISARLGRAGGCKDASGDAPWIGRVLVDESGACPSVSDPAASKLLGFAGKLTSLGDLCGHCVITAENSATWKEVAGVMTALRTSTSCTSVGIEVAVRPGSCETPFVLEQ